MFFLFGAHTQIVTGLLKGTEMRQIYDFGLTLHLISDLKGEMDIRHVIKPRVMRRYKRTRLLGELWAGKLKGGSDMVY